jgi:hypothetical protein
MSGHDDRHGDSKSIRSGFADCETLSDLIAYRKQERTFFRPASVPPPNVNPAFRTEILDLLNQGESVHSLERAIRTGGISAKRGRTPEWVAAISGAVWLLPISC